MNKLPNTGNIRALRIKEIRIKNLKKNELVNKEIADNMRSYWAEQNNGSADWRG